MRCVKVLSFWIGYNYVILDRSDDDDFIGIASTAVPRLLVILFLMIFFTSLL